MDKYVTEVADRELLDVIRRMAYLAEFRRDNLTNHLERIRGYCHVLAKGSGLNSEESLLISYASQLHDIGLIGVPDSVLAKSEKLTDSEWALMKSHPTMGANVLQGSPSVILQAGETIALTHHERWDGSGYPRGIRKEEIPLSGRICALADVFDALTTKRSYKTEIMVGDALMLVQESSGQLFDPALVKIFCDNFGEILKIRSNYP
jgi:putative two-component system response regulator